MTTEGSKRKLAAILSADVKEYSRLMSQDERGTIRILNIYKEAMSSFIQKHRCRVVDSPGDNFLVEFGSVVGAVRTNRKTRFCHRQGSWPDNFRVRPHLGGQGDRMR